MKRFIYGIFFALLLSFSAYAADVTTTVKVPLWDDTETANILVGAEVFESEAQKIELASDSDEFGLATEQDIKSGGDGAKSNGWNVLNSANADAIDVHTTNDGKLTFDASTTSTIIYNADFTVPYVYKNIAGDFDIEVYATDTVDTDFEGTYLVARDPDASVGEDWVSVARIIGTGGVRKQSLNTVNDSSAQTSDIADNRYLRMSRVGNVLTTYTKAKASDAWTQHMQYTRNDFDSNVQVGIAQRTLNVAGTFISTTDYFRGLYPTSGPSPATVPWGTGFAVGDVIDMSTARVVIEKDGIVQAATSTDWKVRYYANNGAASSFLTLTNLRLESDITVTDATNPVKFEAQWNSDGTYKTASTAFILVDVVRSAGGHNVIFGN